MLVEKKGELTSLSINKWLSLGLGGVTGPRRTFATTNGGLGGGGQ